MVGIGTWDTNGNLLAINFNGGTILLRLGQPVKSVSSVLLDTVCSKPSMDETESDGICTNTERTPLLGNRLGKTNNCRLRSSIVAPSNTPVKAGDRRDVDDGTVLGVTLVRREHYNVSMKIRKRHKP